MKRILLVFLVISSLIFIVSCKSEIDTDGLASLRLLCDDFSKKASYQADFFRLNINVDGLDSSLLFAHGSYIADFSDGVKVDAEMTQTVLSSSSAVKVSFDGKTESVTTGSETTNTEVTEKEFFSRIIYAPPFVPDDESIIKTENVTTGAGDGIKIYVKNCEDLLFPLLGDDIYSVALINYPQKQKMKVEDGEITYVFSYDNSEIKSISISFTLYLYDKPNYVPGTTVNENDYELKLFVSFSKSFTK